ncbi:MAG: hypothetical protein IJT79_05280 [Ruminococcus sp.]|nr:hypothetical protein [Ruminococcus sp.]
MSTREIAISLINQLPEEKIEAFLALMLDENTLARLEADAAIEDPTALRFSNSDDLIEELLS